jgi:hypothetical protein
VKKMNKSVSLIDYHKNCSIINDTLKTSSPKLHFIIHIRSVDLYADTMAGPSLEASHAVHSREEDGDSHSDIVAQIFDTPLTSTDADGRHRYRGTFL